MRVRWFLLIGIVLGGLGAAAWLLTRSGSVQPQSTAVVGTQLFQTVFSHVRSFSVDSLGDQELYRRAAAGVIEELDDPYAVLLLPGEEPPPPQDKPVSQGLYLDRRDGAVVVVATVPGSPAAVAGFKSGDRLVAVDTNPADPDRLDLVGRLLDGAAGSRVTLRIRRDGTRALLPIELVRGAPTAVAAAESGMLPGQVGHLTLRRYPDRIADTVRAIVQALRDAGARALVLDLRGTVGGTLAQGVALSDLFLDPGTIIAATKGRQAMASARFQDSTASPFDSLPIAVLVDRGTAGAAEIMAGALQDHDRAAVLGSITFGRGVTQSTFSLGGGTSLRLTTALWLTPQGRQIQRPPRPADGDSLPRPRFKSDGGRSLLGGGGIVPDRLVSDAGPSDLALAAARDILTRAGSTRAVLALVTPH